MMPFPLVKLSSVGWSRPATKNLARPERTRHREAIQIFANVSFTVPADSNATLGLAADARRFCHVTSLNAPTPRCIPLCTTTLTVRAIKNNSINPQNSA
jgi:hypothetical protein